MSRDGDLEIKRVYYFLPRLKVLLIHHHGDRHQIFLRCYLFVSTYGGPFISRPCLLTPINNTFPHAPVKSKTFLLHHEQNQAALCSFGGIL